MTSFIYYFIIYFLRQLETNRIKTSQSKIFKNITNPLFTYYIFSLAIFDIPDDLEILNIPNKLFLLKIKEDNIVTQNGVSCNRSVSDTCKFVRDPSFKNIYVIGDSSLRTLTNSFLYDSRIDNFNIIHFLLEMTVFLFLEFIQVIIHVQTNNTRKNQFGHDISNSIIIYGARFPRYFSGKGFDNGQVKKLMI